MMMMMIATKKRKIADDAAAAALARVCLEERSCDPTPYSDSLI
jgi:hypothetical protein